MALRVAFHKSLLGRSLLFGVLPAAVVVVVIVAINGYRAWENLVRDIEAGLRRETEQIAREIDVRNRRNIDLAQLLASMQESGMFGKRAESVRTMQAVVEHNADVYAACIAYEPNADGNDALGTQLGVPAEALGDGGRMYAYYKRNPKSSTGYTLEPLVETSADGGLWYGLPKRRFERAAVRDPVITKPYNYLGLDIIENVAPIIIDGRFCGVAGVDVSLDEVYGRLQRSAKELDADIFLETRGFFILATSDARGGTPLRTTEVAKSPLSDRFAEVPKSGVLLTLSDDLLTGEHSYFASATVPTGDWRVLVRKPTSSVTARIGQLLVMNALTAAGGISVLVALLGLSAIGISRRVGAAKRAALEVAAGDLATEIKEVKGSDESAELVRSMQRMKEDLAGIVGSVRAAAARLSASSVELAATSRQQEVAAAAFGGSTAQIASAIREISATGSELLRTVGAVDAGARRSAQAAGEGRARLDGMAATMGQLDLSTGEIGDRLQVISEKAAAITSVVETITKVAEQTNLLSVNAAIEAEKAGDSGLGFLVVAREIRRLADQTASATTDIERIVRQMQEAVAAGVSEMTRFTREMRGGTSDVQQVANDLGSIIDEMNSAVAGFSEVERGMTAQSSGVAQIEGAVRQVADGARQTAASVSEFGRVASELSHAVAVLQDAVARFRVSADDSGGWQPTTSGTNEGQR
ncbi:MAG: methyl-accepting chemotaxis protein [bacterium]